MLKDVAPSKFVSVLCKYCACVQDKIVTVQKQVPTDIPGLEYSSETFGLRYCDHHTVGIPTQQNIGVDIFYFDTELLTSDRKRGFLADMMRHSTSCGPVKPQNRT